MANGQDRVVDLNSDLGESFGAYRIGDDEGLFDLISSANVACGFHGGDPRVMERTVAAAKEHGIGVGAHPGFPDLVGFGRRELGATPAEVRSDTLYQIGALDAFCRAAGLRMQHVKAHGALDAVATKDAAIAEAIVAAVRAYDPALIVLCRPGSHLANAARAAGLPVAREGFADRAYNADGNLVSRRLPGAMVTEPAVAAARMRRLVAEGRLETIDGQDLALEVDSICVHADTPGAAAIVRAVREALLADGVAIRPLREILPQPVSDGGLTLRVKPAGEAALLVELGDEIAPETTDRVLRLTAAVEAAALPGVTDLAPGYVTLLVLFDPAVADADALADDLKRLAATADDAPLPAGKLVTIPVAYGGALGPDLADVAAHAGLSEAEVTARHAGAEYRVACPGFVPGWAYLGGLPAALATPRRRTPRTRVPVGSVAIGGGQTGVYPFETPGGWNLIGRSPLRLFDPALPEPALLLPGDRVRFVPIGDSEYVEAALTPQPPLPTAGEGETVVAAVPAAPLALAEAAAGRAVLPLSRGRERGLGGEGFPAEHALHVLVPGLLTTVQDLGRPGRMRHGIGREGALDRAALILGNRLVGNDPGAAGLEITLVGPSLHFERATVVALAGADLGTTLDGQALPPWRPVLIPAGGELVFRPDRAAGVGARAYLCVAGGIDVPPVLDSRSTYLAIGIGGHQGRALRGGDVLPIGPSPIPADDLLRRRLAAPPPGYAPEPVARVVLGPQDDRFTAAGIQNLITAAYRASSRSDRMGLRLEDGAPVHLARGADLISEGIVPGSIQVPGDAQPIVLLHASATAGGYPKVATAIGADLDRLGQVRPGERVRFAAVTADEARSLTLAYRATLGEEAVVRGPRAVGVEGLVEALRTTGVEAIRIELTAHDLRLKLALRSAGDRPAAARDAAARSSAVQAGSGA